MDQSTPRYNILLVDGHDLFLQGLTDILKNEKLSLTIQSALNGKMALQIISKDDIDCVLLDINIPCIDGVDIVKLIKLKKPLIKVIIYTMLCDAPAILKLIQTGADAFIIKNFEKNDLLEAIKKVMNNEKYISTELKSDAYDFNEKRYRIAEVTPELTIREKLIMSYLMEGISMREIAQRLFLNTNTIDMHKKNILAKLGLKNIAGLVKYGSSENIH